MSLTFVSSVSKYLASNTSSIKKNPFSHKISTPIVQKSKWSSSSTTNQHIRSVYSINKITLLGYAGGEPETHTFADGSSLTSFSLAVSESYTSKKTGERVDKTEWFRVAVQNERTQELVAKMVQKGSRVYVEGQLRSKKWTDAVGNERLGLEVLVRNKGEVVVVSRPANEMQSQSYEHQSSHSTTDSL